MLIRSFSSFRMDESSRTSIKVSLFVWGMISDYRESFWSRLSQYGKILLDNMVIGWCCSFLLCFKLFNDSS